MGVKKEKHYMSERVSLKTMMLRRNILGVFLAYAIEFGVRKTEP